MRHLVATEALLAEGNAERARQELAFIFQYQNRSNGMIWHEISQSAGFIDWAGKYPYMYVHVDITFAFLSTLTDYYAATGDLTFLREHWEQIESAYAECRSIVNPRTALPEIPAGKEGGNEQDRMREDVGLSAAWVAASAAYRQLALATAHASEASSAEEAAGKAHQALAARYWDAKANFWIAGYSASGAIMTDERSHPDLLGRSLLAPGQENAVLDRLASADFQTDWGTRSMSAQSPRYDPDSYGGGSVSALLTSEMADAFWRDHRPAIAWPVWQSILPWLQLDSLGHIHELLAGDFYHPQVESVPEQTWSSAGILHSMMQGIFGIDVDAPNSRLTLAPHLDPRWDEVSIAKIPVGARKLSAMIEQKPGGLDGAFSVDRGSVHVSFDPEIPLGATGIHAEVNGRTVPVALEQHAEDEHARVEMDVMHDTVHCRILYTGGVRLMAPAAHPAIGDSSRQLKLTSVALDQHLLTVEADVASAEAASLDLQTPWKINSVDGGSAISLGNGWYRVTFTERPAQSQYEHRRMSVNFQAQ